MLDAIPGRRLARRGALAALVGLALTAGGAPARGGTDPDRRWFTLVTEHFAVHSYDQGEELARRVAGFAEEAFQVLNPLFGWTPEERVHVVVTDDLDSANGFAQAVPHDTITVLAHPPEAASSLGTYDDWLRLLVFHEYAHIVHIDQASGVPRFVNQILGKTLKPNQAVPRWLTEGLATWAESETTGSGRVGSSLFEMFLRAAALGGELPSLAELTGSSLKIPRGTTPYLYGAYLVSKIVTSSGAGAVRGFAHEYGRRVIPYGLNLTLKKLTGKDFLAWYAEVLSETRARAEATRARLEAEDLREGEALTQGGETKAIPRFSPDGRWLVYVLGDGHRETFLARAPVERPTETERVAWCDGGCGRFDFARDGRSLWMTSTRPFRLVRHYDELVQVPFEEGQPRGAGRKLTAGGRVADPRVSTQDRRVWVVKNAWAHTWLEALDPNDGRTLYRWDPPAWARVDTPVPSLDGKLVYFSMHHGGNRDLYALQLDSGRLERLTFGAALEIDPTLTVDGRWLVYASDTTGVFDLYARDTRSGRTTRLTRVLTGAFHPTVSPDLRTFVYVRWTAWGQELYRLPFAPDLAEPVPVPDTRPPRRPREPIPTVITKQDYDPLSTLLPRSWLPTWAIDSSGLNRFGIALGGSDVSGRVAGSAQLEVDLARLDIAVAASLTLRYGYPDLSLSVGRYSWDRTSFYGDRDNPYREEVFFAGLQCGLSLPHEIAPMTIGVGYTANLSRALKASPVAHTPDEDQAAIPREGFDTALALSWAYSDVRWSALGVAPIGGGTASLSLRFQHPGIGSAGTAFTVRYGIRQYLLMPWLADHVLALRLQGGASGGPDAGSFALGGVPQQNLLTDLLNQTQAGADWLRGFPEAAFGGKHYHLLTAEYRLPIYRIRWGPDTLPLYFEDLAAALFADAGIAYDDPFDPRNLERVRVGLGAEVRLGLELFYQLGLQLRLGYAHGFGAKGFDHLYLLMAGSP
jgi:hypothetical protein